MGRKVAGVADHPLIPKPKGGSLGSVPRARSSQEPSAASAGDPRARVHLAAVGFEIERVTDALRSDRADRVYLVTRDSHDAAEPFLARVVREIRSFPWSPEVMVVRTDVFDLFACLATYRRIFAVERRLDRRAAEAVPVRVNVSTGTKITAIAGTLACMLWKGEPYYVRVSKTWYSGLSVQPRTAHDVVDRVEPMGVYELRTPSPELVEVLEALSRRGGSLRKFELIRELGLDQPSAGHSHVPSPQSSHGRLRRRLEPLAERWGFVQIEPRGPRGRVRLTEQGRVALVLFGRPVDDVAYSGNKRH